MGTEPLLCEDEKIHIPGAIQPHGVLLTMSRSELLILQVSESAATIFGIASSEIIGKPLQFLIGETARTELTTRLSLTGVAQLNPLRLVVNCRPTSKAFDAVIHVSEELLVLELEEAESRKAEQSLDFFRTSNDAVSQLLACDSKQKLLETSVQFVQSFTGFDRVLLYLFDKQWNGTVEAECKADGVESYLHLQFPASDIPAQARELYKRNYLRLLVDVNAQPAAILPANNPSTGAPLDLSLSILRSMSPIHIEYLKNMKVAASMSLSLVNNDSLRGLIACHHFTPRHVDYRTRQACEFIARLVSLQIDTLEERENYQTIVELNHNRKDLLLHVFAQEDVPAAIASSGKLLEIARAEGAAVIWNDATYLVGETPSKDDVNLLALGLSQNMSDIVFATDSLAKIIPAAKGMEGLASGLLAVRISTTASRWLLWFRPQQEKEIHWAGNPEKSADAEAHLHPRKSFELWKEKVSGMSQPWSSPEISNALELRNGLLDAALSAAAKKRAVELQQQVEELDALNSQLTELSQELLVARDGALDASLRKSEMVSMVSHDLRAPLTSIKGSLALLDDQLYNIEPEVAELIGIAYNSANYMSSLIENLLQLESLESGTVELKKTDLQLEELVDAAFQLVRISAEKANVSLIVGDCGSLWADRERILQVLVNLISNAIKFSQADSTITVSSESNLDCTLIKVVDQGRGIPIEFRKSIFQRFKQVESDDRIEKKGAGLGLAICKAIVEAHGGTIGVDSELNVGSTFWFELPLASKNCGTA